MGSEPEEAQVVKKGHGLCGCCREEFPFKDLGGSSYLLRVLNIPGTTPLQIHIKATSILDLCPGCRAAFHQMAEGDWRKYLQENLG